MGNESDYSNLFADIIYHGINKYSLSDLDQIERSLKLIKDEPSIKIALYELINAKEICSHFISAKLNYTAKLKKPITLISPKILSDRSHLDQ